MSWSHYAKVSFARFREQGRLYSCKTIHESFLCITTLFLVYRWSEVGWWNVSYVHIMMLAYLWVEWKVLAELEGAGVVLVVLSKLLTLHGNRKINGRYKLLSFRWRSVQELTYQSNEHPVEPAQDIRTIVILWPGSRERERETHSVPDIILIKGCTKLLDGRQKKR